ncbi:MAG: AAA family ATPase [Methanobrevibacter sp.]|jgi:predicted AAA+ superfamily ATPase|nr:AAA family ATPase [Methanobrevibacter sp.]
MELNNELKEYIVGRQRNLKYLLRDVNNLHHRSEFFKIKKYLDDFISGKSIESRFIAMPGLRGVGKSTIVLQLINYLLKEQNINSQNVLYLSMDEVVTFFKANLLEAVDNYLDFVHKTNKMAVNKKIFIFIDECQTDSKWAISGKILYDNSKNIFLICTGSSAIDLEINSDVARRVYKETIYPCNFRDHILLKHHISTDYEFSKTLENIICLGEDKYLDEAIDLEEKVYDKVYNLKNNPKREFLDFLKTYGFPFSLNLKEDISYERTYTVIEKVIEKDIPAIKNFNTSTNPSISRIIKYIALSRNELISNTKIANYLSLSSKLVHEVLNTLEKTQLIFSIKPYAGIAKIIRKPWKYYFLSPSLKSSINFRLGRFNLDNERCLGALAENYVASKLYQMSKTSFPSMGVFYPTEKKGVDFLLRTKLDDIVPVEVGIGKKTKSQLTLAINNYNADYGVLISNRYSEIRKHKNIIHIPLTSFGFL